MIAISVTILILILTIGISLYASSNPQVYQKMIMNPYTVYRHQQYYRFVSSGFIHNGLMHLIFNMFTLYFFGPGVEGHLVGRFGPLGFVYYVVMYLVGIVVSDIPTYLKHKGNPGYNSLGASGAISAIVFAHILYDPLTKLYIYGVIGVPGFILGIVYVIYSYYYDRMGSPDNINHSAHLYGGIFGFVFAAVIEPSAVLEFFHQLSQWKGLFS